MITMGIIVEFYDLRQTLIAWFPILLTVISFNVVITDMMVSTLLILILIYDLHLRINSINETIVSLSKKTNPKPIEINKTVNIFIVNHNKLCCRIAKLSNFWSGLNLAIFLTGLPLTILIMHQLLFENIYYFMVKVLYGLALFCCLYIHFCCLVLFGLIFIKNA